MIQRDVAGFVGDAVFDGQVGLVLKVDGRCGSSGASLFGEVLLDEPLSRDLVNELLAVSNEEESHLGGEVSGVEASVGTVKQGVCSTAEFTRDRSQREHRSSRGDEGELVMRRKRVCQE